MFTIIYIYKLLVPLYYLETHICTGDALLGDHIRSGALPALISELFISKLNIMFLRTYRYTGDTVLGDHVRARALPALSGVQLRAAVGHVPGLPDLPRHQQVQLPPHQFNWLQRRLQRLLEVSSKGALVTCLPRPWPPPSLFLKKAAQGYPCRLPRQYLASMPDVAVDTTTTLPLAKCWLLEHDMHHYCLMIWV